MARVVVLFDSVWGKKSDYPTNVALAASLVKTSGVPQRIIYVDANGLATERALRHAGIQLSLNFDPTRDELYVFGFSRGAALAVLLVDFLLKYGLPPALSMRGGLDPAAAFLKLKAGQTVESQFPKVKVSFLGLWELVAGRRSHSSLSVAPKSAAWDAITRDRLPENVQSWRHAVALDEDRVRLHPTTLSTEPPTEGTSYQLWFPGDHGSVGGGGEITGMSSTALLWVLEGAMANGLELDDGGLRQISSMTDLLAPLRSSLGPGEWLDRVATRRARAGPEYEFELSDAARARMRYEGKSSSFTPYRPRATLSTADEKSSGLVVNGAYVEERIKPVTPKGLKANPRSVKQLAPQSQSVRREENIVEILFCTNRQPGFGEVLFTGERSHQIAYGRSSVSIPKLHKPGSVERPWVVRAFGITLYEEKEDSQRHFVVTESKLMGRDDWTANLLARGDSALIFLHGYNTTFEAGLLQTAQIAWDLRVKAVPVYFSWPSRGEAHEYRYDIDSATFSRKAFVDLLNTMREAGVKHVHVLAHSMGGQLLIDAAQHADWPRKFSLKEIMLAATDMDRLAFEQGIPQLRKRSKGVTLYASSADRALGASRILAGQMPRAGDVPEDGPLVVDGVDTIDVTALGGDLIGHGTYSQADTIMNDLNLILRTGLRPPHDRNTGFRPMPQGAANPTFWRYIPSVR